MSSSTYSDVPGRDSTPGSTWLVGARRAVEGGRLLASDLRVPTMSGAVIALAAVFGAVPVEAARVSLLVLGVVAAVMAVSRLVRPRGLTGRRVVLVGSRQDVQACSAAGLGPDLVTGFLVPGANDTRTPSSLTPTATTLDSLPELVSRVGADSILVVPGVDVTATLVRELTWLFEHSPVTVGVVCPVPSASAHRLRTTFAGPSTVLEVGKPRGAAGSRLAKVVVDRLGAAFLLLVTSPFLLLLWAAVRLDSRGPGFFLQARAGQDGERFQMVRLRTMHEGSESLLSTLATVGDPDSEAFTIRRDTRVTRIGYWLRRSSLDELPQLLNVLRGEMSLVGPRPALPDEVAEYDSVARRRLLVKPGMTGLWQLRGRCGLRWDESLRLDAEYVDNWRLIDDLRIVGRSITGADRARNAF